MPTYTLPIEETDGKNYLLSGPLRLQLPEPREPMAIGWCPPNSNAADVTAMLRKYPHTRVIRIFREPGEGLPPWTTDVMAAVPPHIRVVLSVKEPAAEIAADLDPWMRAMPPDRVPVDLCCWHEPEQQTGGDPTPAVFQSGWKTVLAAAAGKPWLDRVDFLPIYTEYAATRGANAATWMADFGIVGTYPGITKVGFDIYGTGYPAYRTPVQMFGFALNYARQVGDKPLIVAEWCTGQRKATDPTGEQCAQVMIDQAVYLAGQPEADALIQFYRSGCNLDGRIPERYAFAALVGMSAR